jgi:hypothetical protein
MSHGPGRGLWDQPGRVFTSLETQFEQPSWHHTIRVVESLVIAASLIDTHPLRSEPLSAYAEDLLAEAQHLYDQELLAGSAVAGPLLRERMDFVNQRLQRSRDIIHDRPGSAASLLIPVLQQLDELAVARLSALGAS